MNIVNIIGRSALTRAFVAVGAMGFATIGQGTWASSAAGDFPPANDLSIALYRLDPASGTPWAMTIITRLDFVPGVTAVVAHLPDGTDVDLDPFTSAPNQWASTLLFPAVEEMVSAAHGTWGLDVTGTASSCTEFSLTSEDLGDSDFFGFPVITAPVFGSMVPAETNFQWVDPTGSEAAEAIAIEVNSDNAMQYVDTFIGPITVDSTTWDPPELFEVGELTTAGLFYVRYGDATPYSVTCGSIRWDDAVAVPPDYPAQTPRFMYGSAAVTAFTATEASGGTGDVTGDGVVDFADVLRLLALWGPCPDCPEDLDDDGFVGFSDVLIVLGNWD